uniref:Uncharacterized protein n=1 Tax=Ananas comosus var. bracteatus TaxID=296719 RepID=A0A6V7P9H9_ANACO|nr:unnamed protein product [Ananas comosus var. bracteatus]
MDEAWSLDLEQVEGKSLKFEDFELGLKLLRGSLLQAGTPELAYATYVRSCGIEKPTGSSGTDTFQDDSTGSTVLLSRYAMKQVNESNRNYGIDGSPSPGTLLLGGRTHWELYSYSSHPRVCLGVQVARERRGGAGQGGRLCPRCREKPCPFGGLSACPKPTK